MIWHPSSTRGLKGEPMNIGKGLHITKKAQRKGTTAQRTTPSGPTTMMVAASHHTAWARLQDWFVQTQACLTLTTPLLSKATLWGWLLRPDCWLLSFLPGSSAECCTPVWVSACDHGGAGLGVSPGPVQRPLCDAAGGARGCDCAVVIGVQPIGLQEALQAAVGTGHTGF